MASRYGGFEVVRIDGGRLRLGARGVSSGALSPDGGELITTEGVFDTLTGTRMTGPRTALDPGSVFIGWGTSGAVAVTPDGTAYLVGGDAALTRLPSVPYAVSRQSDRVLVHTDDTCDGVYAVGTSGGLSLLRSWCNADLMSLSPDGSTVLVGHSNGESTAIQGSEASGLLDVETGWYTSFPSLRRLTQYGGDDLVGTSWEGDSTVLLAYLVDRFDVEAAESRGVFTRVIRCVIGSVTCRSTPGRLTAPRGAPHTMFSESGAFASSGDRRPSA